MSIAELWRRLHRLLQRDIWHLPERRPGRPWTFLLRWLRIVVFAARRFAANSIQVRAAALGYYSLMSVVPTLALAFGIAKGFGLENALEDALRQRLSGQQAVLDRVIDFANTMLATTRGGVVAGIGFVILLWTVIRLLSNIESSFNAVWGVERDRSAMRKVTDYLAMLIVGPLLFLMSSSATVFIRVRVNAALSEVGALEPLSGVVLLGLRFLPYVFIWMLFALLYLTMPNTNVSIRAGAVAGVVAGTLYQLVQLSYVELQVGVSRYNAVYGSFAALPLFLIWLYVSWLIALVGAELSFAVDNAANYAREQRSGLASHRQRRLLAVRLAVLCAGRFLRAESPATALQLANGIDVPVRLVQSTLHCLVAAGILSEVQSANERVPAYQPARDPARTTFADVTAAHDELAPESAEPRHPGADDEDLVPDESLGEVAARSHALAALVKGSEHNWTLRRLAEAEDAPAAVRPPAARSVDGSAT